MLAMAWRRRSVELVFLLLPVLDVFGNRAAAARYVPRYSSPVVPLIVLVPSTAAHEV